MIQQLAHKYRKLTAYSLFTVLCSNILSPVFAYTGKNDRPVNDSRRLITAIMAANNTPARQNFNHFPVEIPARRSPHKTMPAQARRVSRQADIGGPTQPEMSAFKPVGVDNMVNLFTGDFSYNIPLLDVGGYPVNIFYDGGIGMEQEASWVGLGWNINPGTVSRNMRGVPDDFNGEEKLVQIQDMKPNITWGITLGADLELVGIKNPFAGSVGASLGITFNNYLGPALETSIRGNTALNLSSKAGSEKSAFSAGASLNINASSRTGVTFSPGVSLTAKAFNDDRSSSMGFGTHLSTAYNSRTGIKGLQLSEQVSYNYQVERMYKGVQYADNNQAGAALLSTSISFVKPSYVPALRMPLTNRAGSGRFQLGGAIFGVEGDVEVEVSKQSSRIESNDKIQVKPMVGYLYMEKAKANSNAVMDFTRFNDNEVTPSTPIISVPQYAYDVFSVQGEGTGGSIRAYRNDDGHVRDNKTGSRDESFGVGADVGIPGHYGASFNKVKTPATIGEWNVGNKLRALPGFTKPEANTTRENVYIRNPGETSVLTPGQYDKIGGANLVRFKVGGTGKSPSLEPVLEKFTKDGKAAGTADFKQSNPAERKKRTQVISFLNAEEAAVIGLDKKIKSYNGWGLPGDEMDRYETVLTDPATQYRRKHHISQVNVTEGDGRRYIYGIPAYNIIQKDFTFTVPSDIEDRDADRVSFSAGNVTNPASVADKDGYIQITETPAYAHSFLLTGLLSPDFVDVTGDGITGDDLGNAVKFNYTRLKDGTAWARSKWRTPLTGDMKANLNAGRRTEVKDDKGIVSYGERESWYLGSIESKTMIALFTLENRQDAKGAAGELSGISSANTAQRLKKIELYSKADLKKNGLSNAKPVKTVHFEYSYTLCKGTPDNTTSGGGKLTLEKIYFTFNGKNRNSKNQYVFAYGNQAGVAPSATENPAYAVNASDCWGNYKPASQNPGVSNKNADYPYAVQDKILANENAGAWMLKKVLLPSGGQIEVEYESDDYAFVQNKRAAVMHQVLGFGRAKTDAPIPQLYGLVGNAIIEHNFVFIKVADACANDAEVKLKYLQGVEQLAFKMMVKMPGGKNEYINSYATVAGCGVYTADNTNRTIWVQLNPVGGISPLSLTAIEFLREQLPGQAYPGYDVQGEPALQQIAGMLAGWLNGMVSAFRNSVEHLRQQAYAREVDLNACFVRLNSPGGIKYGGGHRVKSVRLKDNWYEMNGNTLYYSEYGQEYDYTTTEIFNGVERKISSGVASYEPSLGGDENPFHTMVQVADQIPLGPASYGAVEMPVLDAFFPAPLVGYSRVSVRSIKKGVPQTGQQPKSGIGKQVTEFYTAKDYPVYYSYTPLDPESDKQANSSSVGAFFYKYTFDSRAISQGFLVATNDMHGKIRSQASYPGNDETTPLNYLQNFYRNTGEKGLDEKFDFVYASQGGAISQGNMGIDIELMTDTREFTVNGQSFDVQGQLDLFPIFALAPWFAFIWPVSGTSQNTYRAVTTTKVISYHSILDSVVVIDKGSQVSTKNLVYDAETGNVVVNRTNNEYNKSVFTTGYPAYWAYSGMGLAYKNTGAVYENVNFLKGVATGPSLADFESGDELYITNTGTAPSSGCDAKIVSPASVKKLWVIDKNKHTGSLTNPAPNFLFINEQGMPYTRNGVSFKIVRSGHRNMLGSQLASFVSMGTPILGSVTQKLALAPGVDNKIITASAVEFKEKWQVDDDLFKRYITIYDDVLCAKTMEEDCSGVPEQGFNPYVKGMLGNFRPHLSKVFYGSRNETDPQAAVNLPQAGFLNDFKLYWDFNTANCLVPDVANTKWVWSSKVNRINSKGMELETENALKIYTGALYGYGKTLPLAIANNSRHSEIYYDGFEDSDYGSAACRKHLNILPGTSAAIINTETESFQAHTGKYVMQVNAGAAASVTNNLYTKLDPGEPGGPGNMTGTNYNFSLEYGTASIKELSQTGIAAGKISSKPANLFTGGSNAPPAFSAGNLSMTHQLVSSDRPVEIIGSSSSRFQYFYKTTQYAVVTASGTYSFQLHTSQSWGATVTPKPTPLFETSVLTLTIKRLTGEQLFTKSVNGTSATQTFPADLPCDTLVFETVVSVDVHLDGIYSVIRDMTAYSYWNSNISATSYKSLYYGSGCTYTSPLQYDQYKINPALNLEPAKKMLFSAWVRESCTTPCFKQTYSNSGVTIGFDNGGTVLLQPSGPIIEGWQKVEGVFTPPAGAAEMSITFTNSIGDQPVYFDDIRIHPYNANMKSYVYDPVNLRLVAELNENNYASFYEYDGEGTLIRTKVETKEGVKTVTETRSAKQKNITAVQ